MQFNIQSFQSNPKRLFLIDGLGALLTAVLLSEVLARFENWFGMPLKTLYFLAFLALVCAIYSLSCYFWAVRNEGFFLKGIAIANLMYCCLTIGLVIALRSTLTLLGITYFVGEVGVISVLLFIELTVINKNIE
jgi:hypothetical protein